MSNPDNSADDRGRTLDDAAAKRAANKAAEKEDKALARRIAEQERDNKRSAKAADSPSPSWWVPTLSTLMVVGLFWLVVYYLSAEKFPVPGIGIGNMVIGFVLILAGFAMTTRWR